MKEVKKHILKGFDDVMHQLLAELSSLTEEELNWLPNEKSWTAGQVGDHLFKSYRVAEILNGKVENTERDPREKLVEVEKTFLDYSLKMDAPHHVIPTAGRIDKTNLLQGLRDRIEQQRAVILKKDLSKTCLDFAIPEYGSFTRLEWLGFNIVHTKRHLHQLRNIIPVIKEKRKKGIKKIIPS